MAAKESINTMYCIWFLMTTSTLTVYSNVIESEVEHLKKTAQCLENIIQNNTATIFTDTTNYKPCTDIQAQKLQTSLAVALKDSVTSSSIYQSYQQAKQRCDPKIIKRRKRRETVEFALKLPLLPLDTKFTKNFCKGSKSETDFGTINMCTECYHTIEFSERYFPRYHVGVSCNNPGTFSQCLSGEGVCVVKSMYTSVLFDENFVGFEKLHLWKETKFLIPKVCSCELKKDSWWTNIV